MLRDIYRRTADSVITVVLASFISFFVLRAIPGDPARLVVGPLGTDDALAATRTAMGLDRPFLLQYVNFIRDFVRGDWGYSYTLGQDVRPALTSRLAASGELASYAFLLAVVGAVVCACLASYRRGFRQSVVRFLALVGLGSPPFWVALVLLVVFSTKLGFLPGPSGRLTNTLDPPAHVTGLYTIDFALEGNMVGVSDAAAHLLLPTIALALIPWAFLTRLLTATMIDTAEQPHVLVVRSKGVNAWTTHLRHVLANSLLPTVSSCGLIIGSLITGSVLVETVFEWPGVGGLLTDAVSSQDFALVQSFILLSAVIYVVSNLAADVCNRLIDARLRTSEQSR
ncbi:ABC transporter permease [Pedococcus sp. P5_B7]